MKLLDYYATPPDLVGAMLDAVDTRSVSRIIDPSAGDGRLLAAAMERFPTASGLAIDVDPQRASVLRRLAGVDVHIGDFLQMVPSTTAHRRTLAIMNPPFSDRGASVSRARFATNDVSCSRAMAFFLTAASFVGHDGEVVALLPRGVLTNRRDAEARIALERHGALTTIAAVPRNAFAKVATHTVIVRWRAQAQARPTLTDAPREAVPSPRGVLWVTRGALPVHVARTLTRGPKKLPFLHTRAARRPSRTPVVRSVAPRECERIVRPPCLLIPRVGAPAPERLAIHRAGPAVLSDCLYGLEIEDPAAISRLLLEITDRWDLFLSLYGGSCAQFARQEDLVRLLESWGWQVLRGPRASAQQVRYGAHPSPEWVEVA